MGDGWETARKKDRPAVLEVGPDGLVKVTDSPNTWRRYF